MDQLQFWGHFSAKKLESSSIVGPKELPGAKYEYIYICIYVCTRVVQESRIIVLEGFPGSTGSVSFPIFCATS